MGQFQQLLFQHRVYRHTGFGTGINYTFGYESVMLFSQLQPCCNVKFCQIRNKGCRERNCQNRKLYCINSPVWRVWSQAARTGWRKLEPRYHHWQSLCHRPHQQGCQQCCCWEQNRNPTKQTMRDEYLASPSDTWTQIQRLKHASSLLITYTSTLFEKSKTLNIVQ